MSEPGSFPYSTLTGHYNQVIQSLRRSAMQNYDLARNNISLRSSDQSIYLCQSWEKEIGTLCLITSYKEALCFLSPCNNAEQCLYVVSYRNVTSRGCLWPFLARSAPESRPHHTIAECIAWLWYCTLKRYYCESGITSLIWLFHCCATYMQYYEAEPKAASHHALIHRHQWGIATSIMEIQRHCPHGEDKTNDSFLAANASTTSDQNARLNVFHFAYCRILIIILYAYKFVHIIHTRIIIQDLLAECNNKPTPQSASIMVHNRHCLISRCTV